MKTITTITDAPVVDVLKELHLWAVGQSRQIDMIRLALSGEMAGVESLAAYMTQAIADANNEFTSKSVLSWNSSMQREIKNRNKAVVAEAKRLKMPAPHLIGAVGLKWDGDNSSVIVALPDSRKTTTKADKEKKEANSAKGRFLSMMATVAAKGSNGDMEQLMRLATSQMAQWD